MIVCRSFFYWYVQSLGYCLFFFFKQKTAYEMRISDWSSDVCSSDLASDRKGRCRTAGDDADVGRQRPVRYIFEIGLQAVGQLRPDFRRAAITANLREAGKPRLDRMTMPIPIRDITEQRTFRPRYHRLRARAVDASATGPGVEESRDWLECIPTE